MIDLFWAEVHDYDGLREAVRARVEQLNISRSCLDDITGLPGGYCGKVLSLGARKEPKNLGPISLGLMLQATGLKIVLVDDRDALAKVEPMFIMRDTSQARPGNQSRKNAPARKRRRRKKKTLRAASRPLPKAEDLGSKRRPYLA